MSNRERTLTVDTWPNCCIADCEFKVSIGHSEDKCYAHEFGLTVASMDDYLNTPAMDEDEWQERHQKLLAARR